MKDWFFPTAFSFWGDEEREAIARVLASGRFTMGAETEALEQELADFNHRKYAVAVNSGSSANLIAVAALWPKVAEANPHYDEAPPLAVVPALAWATTYAPLVQHRFDLHLEDCDDTWCVPPGVAVAAGGELIFDDSDVHCDLSVSCSILGNPSKGLPLGFADLNDDCESFGATIEGKPTAAFGTIATQSFFWSHQLSAIEGGACLTDDEDLARTMRMLRDHGATRSVYKPKRFEDEYDFRLFGYNVRPVEMHMAIAREQILKAHMHKAARRRNWSRFESLTRDLPITLPPLAEGASPFSLHFEVASPQIRSALVSNLRQNGIDCRLPTGGSFRLHAYGKPWANQETPRADRIHQTGLFLGNAPYDIEEKVAKAAGVIRETLSWLTR